MFKKLQSFLDDFGTRNIFEDNVLVDLSGQAKDLIEGVSVNEIKNNDVMRKRIKNEMNNLKSAIDGAIEDMPRRKIRMAM
jgi:preprotein translocase subunit Sec63